MFMVSRNTCVHVYGVMVKDGYLCYKIGREALGLDLFSFFCI